MAQHTLGRRIVERRDEIRIFGRLYKLMCRLEVLNGFSAHADRDELTHCLGPMAAGLKGAFVVHGERHRLRAMKEILTDAGCGNVHVPAPGQKFQL